MVSATGLNRSSLYATFGGKQELYLAALRRYLENRSQPVFRRLAEDERGLPAVEEFFSGLIKARCSGMYARWGCMVSNAHAGAESRDEGVARILDQHHKGLRDALHAALVTGQARGQLAGGADPAAAAEVLALVAYGVNLRSRAGASARSLQESVSAALALIGAAVEAAV
ncbi:TetR/AcrR family transcriptional regulator [Streptomyces sp. NPDC048518]|uniref:TetR family transcriptional regulator C-terminal domain-containing protein n=1 Tax=Streptomyces sp. NPDC048518 TaxID=3155029 RepID=UPI0034034B2E